MISYLFLGKVLTVVSTVGSADVHESISETRGVALGKSNTHAKRSAGRSSGNFDEACRDLRTNLVHFHGTTLHRVGHSHSEEGESENVSSHHLDSTRASAEIDEGGGGPGV